MQTGDVDGDVADGIDGSATPRASETENGRVGGACRRALSPSPAGIADPCRSADHDRARRRLSCFRALSKSIFLLLDAISPYNYITYTSLLYYIYR